MVANNEDAKALSSSTRRRISNAARRAGEIGIIGLG
jgi:hypothetical protein